jgi:hypothetical protein
MIRRFDAEYHTSTIPTESSSIEQSKALSKASYTGSLLNKENCGTMVLLKHKRLATVNRKARKARNKHPSQTTKQQYNRVKNFKLVQEVLVGMQVNYTASTLSLL